MNMQHALCFILIGYVTNTGLVSLATADPCTSYSGLPRAEYRGGQCSYDPGKATCDRTLTSDWYRAVGRNGDLQMQETNAGIGTCGTKFPYWMNGTHPTVADGEVLREVCMTSVISYCDGSQPINVKNCGGFYVYRLDAVPSCDSGYCFGEMEACPPFDPCDVYENVREDYDPGRSSVCNQHGDTSCDNFDHNTWYSFRNPVFGYLNVTTRCSPDRHACGTQHALYIETTNPGTVDSSGSVETTVCEQDYPSCCGRRFNIRSKECKGFMVYKFLSPPTGVCHRYCLDDSTATCPTATTSTTIKSTTQGSLGQITSTENEEAHGSAKKGADKDIKPYIWVIVGVATVAVVTIITVAVVVVKMMPKHRAKVRQVNTSPVISYAEQPPPYIKQ